MQLLLLHLEDEKYNIPTRYKILIITLILWEFLCKQSVRLSPSHFAPETQYTYKLNKLNHLSKQTNKRNSNFPKSKTNQRNLKLTTSNSFRLA